MNDEETYINIKRLQKQSLLVQSLKNYANDFNFKGIFNVITKMNVKDLQEVCSYLDKNLPKKIICTTCNEKFFNYNELYNHEYLRHER